jgi:replicative DNA helicase
MSTEKMLPHNNVAEQGLLGSLIIDPATIADIEANLEAKHFYVDRHRVIFAAIKHLYDQKIPADFITLVDLLDRQGKLELIEGGSYLTFLVNGVPTSGNAEYYANIVTRCWIQRQLLDIAGQIADIAYNADDDVDILSAAEKLLFDIHQGTSAKSFTTMSDLVSEFAAELDYLHEHRGEMLGVPTGYIDLDRLFNGFQKADLILLGGRPSMGKTALALCIALNAAARGNSVAIFSLEMSKKLIGRRFAAMRSGVDSQRLRGGWIEDDEWTKIEQGLAGLSPLPVYINDTSGNPIKSMRSQIRRHLQQHPEGLDLVIVDYIGLINPDDDANKKANQEQIISEISKGLKNMAREFDVPVLALCQLNRSVESRTDKRPDLSDLRASGSLEQDADIVMFTYRDDYYHKGEEGYVPTNLAEILIRKHRNGPTGEVVLFFRGDLTCFYTLDVIAPGEEQ